MDESELKYKIAKEVKRTASWPRKPAYESLMAKSCGMMASCNSCDRIIWEDENCMDSYMENDGYCPECAKEIVLT